MDPRSRPALQAARVFRACHPDDVDTVTWAPRGNEKLGRRLDHLFASGELRPRSCCHHDGWRRDGLGDHSPIEAVVAVGA